MIDWAVKEQASGKSPVQEAPPMDIVVFKLEGQSVGSSDGVSPLIASFSYLQQLLELDTPSIEIFAVTVPDGDC
jgi:hypothetical protein